MSKINLNLEFDTETAIQFFRSNNIKVTELQQASLFGLPTTKGYMVQNPATGGSISLERAFLSVLDIRLKRMILQDIDKLSIFEALKNCKN